MPGSPDKTGELPPGFEDNSVDDELTEGQHLDPASEIKGETVDDAIGESFDKVAKLLNLSYPGGPEIEKLAKFGNTNYFDIPHPLKYKKNLL